MSGLFLCLSVLLVFPAAVPLQKAQSKQKDPARDLWLVRAQSISDELVNDAAKLEPSQRSILFGRLAQQWWRDNPEKARSWMVAAMVYVEAIPNQENPEERRKRISTARQLLQMVTPLDHKLSARLVELLKQDENQLDGAERFANAEGLLDAARSLVDSDPLRASQLGAAALSIDHSSNIYILILSLRQQNPKLADAMLAQALALARQTLEAQLLMNLTRAAYPAEMQVTTNTAPPPDLLRAELLQVQLSYLQANPITRDNRNAVCAGVASFILPVLAEFERRLPQQAPVVRQAVNQCQSLAPLAQQLIDDALRPEPLNTIDGLLKAAQDSEDIKVRTVYKYRAATLARDQKNYEKALTILDRMSAEERAFMGNMWQVARWDWASLAAFDQYSHSDFSAMQNTINAVPDDLSAFAKLAFVDRLPQKRNKEMDPAIQFLAEARQELAASYGSEADRCDWYFALLRLTFQNAPQNSAAILKEAIAALNRSDQAEEKAGRNEEVHFKRTAGTWKNLPVALIDLDEYAVREAVSSINSTTTRVAARLGLLQGCLERMRSLNSKTTP